MQADILIVGAGVAGSLLGTELAKAGRQVLIIDAGSRVDRKAALGQWAASGGRALDGPYRTTDGDRFSPFPGSVPQLGTDPFKSTWVRRVGGSTWHWQGSTPRMIPSDFELHSRFGRGVDWPISYDELEPWYGIAEHALGVSGDDNEWRDFLGAKRSTSFPMPAIWPSWSDRQIKAKINGMNIDGVIMHVRSVPQARNSQPYQGRPPCAGNSSCIPICPIGAKYDASVHVKLSEAAGARVLDRCVATRILVTNDKIAGIEVVDWSSGEPKNEVLIASTYVLCAHSVETARLLLCSGVANSSGLVGRFVMDHPGGSIAGLTPEPCYPFRGPPVTSGIDDWRDGSFRSQHSAWRFSLGNDGQGRVRTTEAFVIDAFDRGLLGAELRSYLENEGSRLFRLSWSTEQLPDFDNRVELLRETDFLGMRKAGIAYRVGDYSLTAFTPIRQAVSGIFTRAGISEPRGGEPTSWTGSGHVLGTCRMGNDTATSVVNRDCRSHDHCNLFIVGSAVFPTVGTANPTLTVAALALRAAALLEHE